MAFLACASARSQPAQYQIDPEHTFVTFEIVHFGTSTNRGRFDRSSGSVQLDRDAKAGSVDVSIDMASINTGTQAFDGLLRGFQFFDVATFPTARFVADDLSFHEKALDEVSGMLTLRGRTHQVVLKAKQFNCYIEGESKREVCGGDFETVIDRSDWGVNYGIIFGFPKSVHLIVQVEAREK